MNKYYKVAKTAVVMLAGIAGVSHGG